MYKERTIYREPFSKRPSYYPWGEGKGEKRGVWGFVPRPRLPPTVNSRGFAPRRGNLTALPAQVLAGRGRARLGAGWTEPSAAESQRPGLRATDKPQTAVPGETRPRGLHSRRVCAFTASPSVPESPSGP